MTPNYENTPGEREYREHPPIQERQRMIIEAVLEDTPGSLNAARRMLESMDEETLTEEEKWVNDFGKEVLDIMEREEDEAEAMARLGHLKEFAERIESDLEG